MQDEHQITGKIAQECKYGENAWQTPAGLYSAGSDDPLSLDKFTVVAGTDPSYNNWAEVDRQLQTITHIAAGFEANGLDIPKIAVGTKHGNPCGAAADNDGITVVQNMLMGDARAIFGGLVMLNFAVDKDVAELLIGFNMEGRRRLLDGVIAPSFSEEALEVLARKGGKCRCIANPALSQLGVAALDVAPRQRYVRGGFLHQPNYTYVLNLSETSSSAELSNQQKADVILAWGVGSTSNSNTVTLVLEGQLIGNGVGQQDRVSCCELALKRARDASHASKLKGATAYSDSFFPFPDGPGVLINAGITTIFATSGSVRDAEIQTLCREKGVTLCQLPDIQARGFFGH